MIVLIDLNITHNTRRLHKVKKAFVKKQSKEACSPCG